jgi:hypothetical protein
MLESPEPRASRARLPAGYRRPADPARLLPWRYAQERLERAQHYWICTASLTGRPHAVPLWGAWVDNRLYFEGSEATRWGRNLVANPWLSVHLESGREVVIVEGPVTDVDDVGAALAERVAAAYAAKYDGYRTGGHGFFILSPRVALGWSQFPHDLTRWRFSGS